MKISFAPIAIGALMTFFVGLPAHACYYQVVDPCNPYFRPYPSYAESNYYRPVYVPESAPRRAPRHSVQRKVQRKVAQRVARKPRVPRRYEAAPVDFAPVLQQQYNYQSGCQKPVWDPCRRTYW